MRTPVARKIYTWAGELRALQYRDTLGHLGDTPRDTLGHSQISGSSTSMGTTGGNAALELSTGPRGQYEEPLARAWGHHEDGCTPPQGGGPSEGGRPWPITGEVKQW